MGCRLWGRTESDTTEATQQQQAAAAAAAASMNLQMSQLDLEKAEEPVIKLPIFAGS